ncbi:MAG: hypothetical protein WKI04_07300 [Ferruginibacter sp.]
MKIIFSYLLIATSILSVNAQESDRIFKRFKGDVSLGVALPTGSTANGGILFAMEPKFALMNKLSVGLRIEGCSYGQVYRQHS